MPHAIVLGDHSLPLVDVVELGQDGGPRVRFERLAGGDAVVMAPAGGRLDGAPMLGGMAVIDWGGEALVRVAGMRIEVRWRAGVERRTAATGMRCSLCFGAMAPGEAVLLCRCAAPLHEECAGGTISCPCCGAPNEARDRGDGQAGEGA